MTLEIPTDEIEFRTEVLTGLGTLQGKVGRLEQDNHRLIEEIYPRLSDLERFQSVAQDRWQNQSEEKKEAQKEKREEKKDVRGFWYGVGSALLVASLMGMFTFVINLNKSEPEYPDRWQERGK